jgi:phosphatidylinositol alpha-1,6-mannosyltransferase
VENLRVVFDTQLVPGALPHLSTIPSVRQPGILLVTEVFPPAIGGSGVLLENVYRRLTATPVTVLTDGASAGLVEIRGGLETHQVPMRAHDWGLLRPSCLRRHLRVARAVHRLTPAQGIVHCGRGLPEGLSARMARAASGAPYICWTHGEELGFASTSRELTWLIRRVFADARAIIANSRNSKRLLVERWGLGDPKVHVVHPGVDVARFHPGIDGDDLRARYARQGDVVFLSVGRLQRRKGHDTVLAALARLRQSVPQVRYVIVGDGPERAALEQLARDAGVADITHFVGVVPEDELPRWYRACDVFVLPNRTEGVDFEGFGIVFLEAAAAGLPVVGGRSGGVPETMIEGASGHLVGGADAGELASILTELARLPELRRRFGARGRQWMEAEFSWARAAEQVANLNEACAARATRAA